MALLFVSFFARAHRVVSVCQCSVSLSEMVGDTHFERYIPDPHPEILVAPEEVKRHVLCTGECDFSSVILIFVRALLTKFTGQVYHTLLAAREERGIKDIAISRIEQISPFPYDLVRSLFYSVRRLIIEQFHRSRPTWTSTPTPLNFGARRNL